MMVGRNLRSTTYFFFSLFIDYRWILGCSQVYHVLLGDVRGKEDRTAIELCYKEQGQLVVVVALLVYVTVNIEGHVGTVS